MRFHTRCHRTLLQLHVYQEKGSEKCIGLLGGCRRSMALEVSIDVDALETLCRAYKGSKQGVHSAGSRNTS